MSKNVHKSMSSTSPTGRPPCSDSETKKIDNFQNEKKVSYQLLKFRIGIGLEFFLTLLELVFRAEN